MVVKGLNSVERRVFTLHMIYSVIEGIIQGVIILNEFIFTKSMLGSKYQLGVLIQFSMVVLILSVLGQEILKRHPKRKILRITAVLSRLPLLALAIFPTVYTGPDAVIWHYLFLLVFLMYYLMMPVVFPIINGFLKNNYRKEYFGSLYSYSQTTNKIVMMVTTFLVGLLLDYNNYAFTWVYPALSVMGIVSLFLLAAMDDGSEELSPVRTSIRESIKNSYLKMKQVILHNKPYRDFEIGFMLYGFAFMLTSGIITLFLVDKLNLNYTSIAFYKNSYNLIAILLLPFFGKMLNTIDPRKFAAFTFFTLLMYLFFMALTEYYPFYFDWGEYRFYYMLLLSFSWNGLFAATMSLLWNIGSAYFCGTRDATSYQSVHLTLVGMRGMFAPLMGIWLYEYIGYSGVFGLGIATLSAAIIVMFISIKKEKEYTNE